ncbi:EscT/YscT/HrcT family type III secretion system export apparatus protein [Ideonella sp.]|uniref:EscT/YscT/HrcT family type III secretion system export apparatus protein n=1 Tax=Ideonella sp. TaxID=1929293 RepID=UPI0037BF86F9
MSESPLVVLQAAAWLSLLGIRVAVACVILPPMNIQQMGHTGPVLALMMGAWLAWGQVTVVQSSDLWTWVGLFAKEALIGAALGVGCATIFWVAEAVGVLLDAQTGFNNIQQNEPMRNEQNTPLGISFLQAANTLFFVAGGVGSFLWLLFDSYRWWPVFEPLPKVEVLFRHLTHQITHVSFNQVVTFSLGMVGLMILVDWTIGMLNRVSSKLDINSLGQPFKAMLVLSLLASLAPHYLDDLADLASLRHVCPDWLATGLVPERFVCRP